MTGSQATQLQVAVNLLNAVAGNVGKTVRFGPDHAYGHVTPYADVVKLVQAMAAGEIEVLVLGTAVNPAFTLPGGLKVADAVHKVPFVVSFATPLYCQTRTCGPVVQVVQSVAKDWQAQGVDFIHVEIYKDNDPAKGTNRWVDEWKLRSEPFTFVVDKNGVIRSRFEGAFSAAELETAVSKVAP